MTKQGRANTADALDSASGDAGARFKVIVHADGPAMTFTSGQRASPNHSIEDPGTRPRPFSGLAQSVRVQAPMRAAITAAYRRPEPECVGSLIEHARLGSEAAAATRALARRLILAVRGDKAAWNTRWLAQELLREFSLASEEGIALMRLAEALLRIPDTATRDALIRDQIGRGNWRAQVGHPRSIFANVAAWGLRLTGALGNSASGEGLLAPVSRTIAMGGEPLIRASLDRVMRLVSEQFVAGGTIEEALDAARARESKGFCHSYDMLGEAAMTDAEAERYCNAYALAIHAIGKAAGGSGVHGNPGISVKLSALHPRFSRSQYERVASELWPRLRSLARLARRYAIGLTIDAEEAAKLDVSLDLLEELCRDADLAGWDGIGIAVQAYQKRAPAVIDWLIDLAGRTGHRLMIRLVKGAYWDSEIKRAQVEGLDGYPVYTRKVHTDLCYFACARKLLAAAGAVYPQFATHNAQTLASVYHLAQREYHGVQYEFQCLHGMGERLYEQLIHAHAAGEPPPRCRVYAPVGTRATLLAYLVRRLLENGANTSFLHRLDDERIAVDALIADPVTMVESITPRGAAHPAIPLPLALYGEARSNSIGLDWSDESELAWLSSALAGTAAIEWIAAPMIAKRRDLAAGAIEIRNPADHRDLVGKVVEANDADIDAALANAFAAEAGWAASSGAQRAGVLDRAAKLLEARRAVLLSLAVREAGKTLPNAVAEVREAVDFLRYYAAQIRGNFADSPLQPRGTVVCISPWNFPLAIFIGQVAAALAAGNTVIAKPAEQTPLVAALAVRLLHTAGVPEAVLQLLPGRGETVGARLVADARVQAVVFTGSTEVAKLIQRSLAPRLDRTGCPVTLIAETGGQNAMIVDSSALPEQVVADVLQSAFDSAGQRCSALRVLCLQQEIAARVVAMLEGAMRELVIGPPDRLSTDVGPLIDANACRAIAAHIESMRARGRRVRQFALPESARHGTFVAPAMIEIDAIGDVEGEVFGPVLHVLVYRRDHLDALLAAIEAAGYGLTLGIHTRVDNTVARIASGSRAGNIYVNRNMVGAVVGVQPFGGAGLSGTGPKAGGPLYVARLARDQRMRPLAPGAQRRELPRPACAFRDWLGAEGDAAAADRVQRYLDGMAFAPSVDMPGPTGERNTYSIQARGDILCLAATRDDLLAQLAAVLATGNRAVLPDGGHAGRVRTAVPDVVRAAILLTRDWTHAEFQHVLFAGTQAELRQLCVRIAARPGPIIGIQSPMQGRRDYALEPLLVERSLSVNTAAAGGNTDLMARD